ncbi:Stage 0 sporulation protein M [Azospirillaceae bacterium]
MGLFRNLKNMVTGDSAEVVLDVNNPGLGRPFPIRISATIGQDDCKIQKVYLRIVAEENVRVPDIHVAERFGEEVRISTQTVSTTTITYDATIDIASAQVLKAEQQYQWEAEITIPDEALPSYQGPNAQHLWKLLAGLDVRGNDPDSDWLLVDMHY